jgi:zinc/manganese transport system ATP-binding protein
MNGPRAAGTEVGIDNLTLGYDRHPAVHHLSGSFAAGSLTAVTGPNGAGKSTLLKGLIGILRPLEGRIEPGAAMRQQVAYLPQQAEIDRSFPISVLDIVLLGHWHRVGAFGRMDRALKQEAAEALDAVGINGFSRRPIASLSAGQFQRALFARMLLQDRPVILLDEPFTAIDARTTRDLIDVILRWHGEKRTIIVVLHDLEQVRSHFPETLLLAREPIAWGPTAEVLTAANLQRARAMVETWDERAQPCKRRAS